jgi:hypothetical protein
MISYKGVTTIPLTPIKGIALMGNIFIFFTRIFFGERNIGSLCVENIHMLNKKGCEGTL